MMFENDITCEYFVQKGIMMLLFTTEYEDALTTIASDLYIDYDNFLVILRDLVNRYYNAFDDGVKANLDRIIEYFRYDYCDKHPDEREKVYETINEIIQKKNSSSLIGVGLFVSDEWNSRYGDNDTLKVMYSQSNIIKTYDKIKALLEYDYCILSSHSEMIDDEEFLDVATAFIDINSVYVICLNKILNDCPEVLKDEIFKKRAKFVLRLINENLASAKKGDTDESLKKLRQRHGQCYSKVENLDKLYKLTTEKKL